MKNQTLSFSLAAILVSGATFLAAGAPAIAQPTPDRENFEFRFEYTKAELETEQAASNMLNRLHKEIRQHCAVDPRQVADRANKACIDQTMARVVGQIGSSTLASVHSERLG